LKLLDYKKPETIKEAFDLYEKEGSEIIGGGAWLKLGKQTKQLGIDLEKLELNKITKEEEGIHIGAMTTLYQVETSKVLQGLYNGILSEACSKVMGVQVRNIATMGGTVCGKFGFSDIITPLLAMNAKLHFYKSGMISLEDFLLRKGKVLDILTEIIIPGSGRGMFSTFKKTAIDFALVNASVCLSGDLLSISVGARPGLAKVKRIKVDEIRRMIEETSYHETGEILVKTFNYGSNQRASKEYRIHLAGVLIADGIKEVLA